MLKHTMSRENIPFTDLCSLLYPLGKINSSFKNMNVGAFWFIGYIDEND